LSPAQWFDMTLFVPKCVRKNLRKGSIPSVSV
jgi:hypothetical protein